MNKQQQYAAFMPPSFSNSCSDNDSSTTSFIVSSTTNNLVLPIDCFQIEEVEEGKDMEEAILTTTPSGTLHQYGQMDATRTTTPDDKTL